MGETLSKWLKTDQQPADFYELLGRPLFDPDTVALQEVVQSSYAELLPYQNHKDPAIVQRAVRLQRELGRAADTISSPAKLRVHHAQILQSLRQRYVAACQGQS